MKLTSSLKLMFEKSGDDLISGKVLVMSKLLVELSLVSSSPIIGRLPPTGDADKLKH
jgi:hypothetical protein